MKRFLKWSAYGLGSLVVLALVALALVYGVSEYRLERTYEVPRSGTAALELPDYHEARAEGRRLARIRGCIGCHRNLDGQVMLDEPWMARLSAPNLTRSVRQYSLSELEGIIRYGVYPDGRGAVLMPSSMYRDLSDYDLGAILAYIRSVEPVDKELPENKFRLLARLGIALGKFKVEPEKIATMPPPPVSTEPGPTPAYGEYLARTVCTECHGTRLEGGPMGDTPGLVVAKAYKPDQFRRLLREGKALGDRELGLMAEVARGRFSHFTDTEIDALYAYLKEARLPIPE